jgi:hypothetical protein
MPRKPNLAESIRRRIASNRRARTFVRQDFLDVAGYDQVGRALAELVEKGFLVRTGFGEYAKPAQGRQRGDAGSRRPASIMVDDLRSRDREVPPVATARKCRPLTRLAIPASGIGRFVKALAKRHNITYVRTYTDAWGEAVTRLSDDDVQTDSVERLLISLKRAGKVSADDMVALLVGYLREKRGIRPV